MRVKIRYLWVKLIFYLWLEIRIISKVHIWYLNFCLMVKKMLKIVNFCTCWDIRINLKGKMLPKIHLGNNRLRKVKVWVYIAFLLKKIWKKIKGKLIILGLIKKLLCINKFFFFLFLDFSIYIYIFFFLF